MQGKTQSHSDAVARLEALKAQEKLCCERLESLNRMLHRLSPSDHLFGAVIRGIAKWSREQMRTDEELWDALSAMNSMAEARATGPRLQLVE